MKASELLVRCLENEGIDAIYGIPYTLRDMQVEKLTVIRSAEIG